MLCVAVAAKQHVRKLQLQLVAVHHLALTTLKHTHQVTYALQHSVL